MSFKFTVIKKNQILASAVTLMLVTAGYLNYKYDPTKPYDIEVTGIIEENLGDAVLVDANGIIKQIDENIDKYSVSNEGATPVFNNTTDILLKSSGESKKEDKDEKVFNEIEDYFISTRIDRTNSYAEQIETYENILNSSGSSDEQKNKAQEEIIKINNIRNSIMISENLIKLKGFDETVVLVSENSINVVVASETLSGTEIAQLQSVIVNEFSIDIGKVHIISYE